MQTNECAAILAAPAYFRLLLQFDMLKPELLPSLTSVTLGTAPVDQSLVKKIRERFPQINIYLRYGLTETIGTLTRLTLGPGEILSHPGLVGTPIPGAELAPELPLPDQGEPGEIRVKSGIVAVGELLEKDQWRTLTDNRGLFSTGDLGYMDEKGQLHLRGRISSFIKRNGFRINPFEIESLLREMPGIQEAMVVGVPDPLSGQQVIAYVEPMPGKPDPDPKDLMNICAANLSAYKLPQRIVVTDAIPKTRSGKIVRTGD
jgi:acyl-CoA synthetase (AMP-forming)/AMP-acid ligase II